MLYLFYMNLTLFGVDRFDGLVMLQELSCITYAPTLLHEIVTTDFLKVPQLAYMQACSSVLLTWVSQKVIVTQR